MGLEIAILAIALAVASQEGYPPVDLVSLQPETAQFVYAPDTSDHEAAQIQAMRQTLLQIEAGRVIYRSDLQIGLFRLSGSRARWLSVFDIDHGQPSWPSSVETQIAAVGLQEFGDPILVGETRFLSVSQITTREPEPTEHAGDFTVTYSGCEQSTVLGTEMLVARFETTTFQLLRGSDGWSVDQLVAHYEIAPSLGWAVARTVNGERMILTEINDIERE